MINEYNEFDYSNNNSNSNNITNNNNNSNNNSNTNTNIISFSNREPIETMLRKTNNDFKRMQESLFQNIQNLDNENVHSLYLYIYLYNISYYSYHFVQLWNKRNSNYNSKCFLFQKVRK